MNSNKSDKKNMLFLIGRLNVSEKIMKVTAVYGFERSLTKWSFVTAMVAAFVIISAVMVTQASAADNYAWVAKGPVGANANHLVCSSNNPGVVFAGTNGGVYKTTDYGDSWFYSGLRFRPIDALRGSGACNMGIFAGASGYVFQTTNGGSTWTDLGPIPGSEISAFLMTNPPACKAYIGTRNEVFTPNGPGLTGMEITALEVDSSNNVYAGTGNGVYKTTDNGLSWNPINNGLPPNTQIFSLKIDGSNRIFAGTLGAGVLRSMDFGDSWVPINSGLPIFDGNSGFYVAYSLAKDTDGSLYAGMVTDAPLAGSVYKSTNSGVSNGVNWSKTGDAIDGYFPESMCVTPDNRLFVGTNKGMFRTDDFGGTWINLANKISAIPFANTFAAYSGTIFTGTEGEGVYKSGDGGETWTEAGTGSPRNVGALLVDGSGYLYASASDIAGMYKSEDGGDTWALSSNGLPSDSGFLIEGTSLALDGNGAVYVGLDNGEVWKTFDQAGIWVPTGSLPSNSANITAMAGIGSQAVLAGTNGNGIYRTTNGGTTWGQINAGLPIGAHIIEDSFFVDGNTGYIFVGLGEGGLYWSTDGGDNWAQVSMPGVTGCSVRSATRGTVNTGILYAVVCNGAIFQSSDNGANWTPFSNNGLKPWDNVEGINVVGIFAYNGAFVAATESSGMYKFSKDLVVIEGKPGYYASLQDAYNAAALSGDSILALAVNFYSEDLFFNTLGKSVILIGGYEAGFTVDSGKTSITRALTVSQGTVVLQNMVVRSLTVTEQGAVYTDNVVIK